MSYFLEKVFGGLRPLCKFPFMFGWRCEGRYWQQPKEKRFSNCGYVLYVLEEWQDSVSSFDSHQRVY